MDLSREDQLNGALELFHFAFRAFTAGPDRILEAQGLQRVHHRILYFVGRNPGISVNGILGILGVTKQALNAPLRRLLELQLVEVRIHAEDRRMRELRLTPEGAKLESSLSGGQRKLMEKIFQEASPASESAWRKVMGMVSER